MAGKVPNPINAPATIAAGHVFVASGTNPQQAVDGGPYNAGSGGGAGVNDVNTWSQTQTFSVAAALTAGATLPLLSASAATRALKDVLTERWVPLTAYSTLSLDGTTSDSVALNTILASAANTTYVLPKGKTLAHSTKIRFTQPGVTLILDKGASLKLLAAGAIGAQIGIEQNDCAIIGAPGTYGEINGNSAAQSNSISGITTSAGVTGVWLENLRIHHTKNQRAINSTDLGAATGNPSLTIRNLKYDNCFDQDTAAGTGILIQVSAATVSPTIDVSGVTGDRSAAAPTNASLAASFNIVGLQNYPIYGSVRNVVMREPIAPTASYGAIGYKNFYGAFENIEIFDGSIGLSYASPGYWPVQINGFRSHGGNQWPIELPTLSVASVTGSAVITNFVIDGVSASGGSPITPYGISIAGEIAWKNIAISNGRIFNVTEAGIRIAGSTGTGTPFADISLDNIDIDVSTVTGATFGDTYGIVLRGNGANYLGPKKITLNGVQIHGGGVATRAIYAMNALHVYGSILADGINGATVQIVSNGNTTTTDNWHLRVNSADGNAASAQLTLTSTNSGAFGHQISIGGNNFIPYAAGYFGDVLDASIGLIHVYGSSPPDGTLNGCAGSTCLLTNGDFYVKTTALGTLTGWVLWQDHLGNIIGTNITATGYSQWSVGNALTAVGTNRATALQLAKQINNVTTAAAGTGVALPVGVVGMWIDVFNAGANLIQVYAAGSETIDTVAGSTGVPLTNTKRCRFYFVAANTWISALAEVPETSVKKTSNYTPSGTDMRLHIATDASGGSFTVTLPASPTDSQTIRIKDEYGTCDATHIVTIAGTVDGTVNPTLAGPYNFICVRWNATTNKWAEV